MTMHLSSETAMGDGTQGAPQRHLRFERVFNFRDLGGYTTAEGATTRWRTVFRADSIFRADPEQFAPLGLGAVLDLRTEVEVQANRFEAPEVAWHHLPVLRRLWEEIEVDLDQPAERFLADRYHDMIEDGGEALARAVELVADPATGPVVFHCAAGKDRTGVTAALLLGLVGVSNDVIAADYALSQQATDAAIEYARVHQPDLYAKLDASPTMFLQSPRGAMELFLAEVDDRYGSLRGLADHLGVGDDTVDALRNRLVD